MADYQVLETSIAKVTLGLLVLLQIATISYGFNAHFGQYLTIVLILMSLPFAYFGLNYLGLRPAYPASHYKSHTDSLWLLQEHTRKAVNALMTSPAFRAWRQKRQKNMEAQGQTIISGQVQNDRVSEANKQIEQIALELLQKEEIIFAD